MEGKGKLVYSNGDVYEGYFKEGQLHGIGHFKTACYEYYGPFRADRKEGKGTLLFAQGGKFEGWFERDQVHGYGEYHAKNG